MQMTLTLTKEHLNTNIDLKSTMREVSLIALSRIQKNVTSNIGPDNAPLTQSVKQNNKTLRDTDTLLASLNARHDATSATVATPLKYAAIQNTGGEIVASKKFLYLPASSEVRKFQRTFGFSVGEVIKGLRSKGISVFRAGNARVIFYKKKNKEAEPLFFLVKSVKIPKREFMFLPEQTVAVIDKLISDVIDDKILQGVKS